MKRILVTGMSGLIGGLEVLGELVFSSEEEERIITNGEIDYLTSAAKSLWEDILVVQVTSGGKSSGSGLNREQLVFKTAEEESDYICCGLTIGAFIGIIVAVVVVLGIIIGVVVYKYKKAQAARQAMETANSNSQLNQQKNNQNKPNPNPYPQPPPNQMGGQGQNPNPYFNQPNYGQGGYPAY